MKIKSVFLMLIFIISNEIIYSQSYFFSVKYGYKQEVFNAYYNLYKTQIDVKSPVIRSEFKIMYPNQIEIGWGLGYYSFSQNIKMYNDFPLDNPFEIQTGHDVLYRALSQHFQFGYNVRLIKDFYLKFSTGGSVDIYFDDKYFSLGIDSKVIQSNNQTATVYYGAMSNSINLLLSNTISLQYITPFKLSISIYGCYHTGILPVVNNVIYFENGSNNFSDVFSTYGSYIDFGIGLGYCFLRKS